MNHIIGISGTDFGFSCSFDKTLALPRTESGNPVDWGQVNWGQPVIAPRKF